MGSYDEHLRYGWISHLLISIITLLTIVGLQYSFEVAIAVVGVSLPVSLGASVLPDIDHHASNTNSLFRYGLFLSISSIIALTLSQFALSIALLWLQVTYSVTSIVVFLTLGIFSILIGASTTKTFDILRPVHRGVTHSIAFSVGVSVLVGVFTWHATNVLTSNNFGIEAGLIFAVYTLAGILSHLYLDDELLSDTKNQIRNRGDQL